MEVVAECVETPTALALLSVMGCDMAQGFYISRPIEIDAVRDFLDQHRGGWHAQTDCGSLAKLTAVLRRA